MRFNGGMPRIRLDLAYDGTFFSGWAAQPGLRTVEGVLAAALARGIDLTTALRWANVAGALTTTRFGPATCPSGAQIRALA